MRSVNADPEWLVRSYPWLVFTFVGASFCILLTA